MTKAFISDEGLSLETLDLAFSVLAPTVLLWGRGSITQVSNGASSNSARFNSFPVDVIYSSLRKSRNQSLFMML